MEKGESFGSVEGRTFVTRAVERRIEAGFGATCAADCEQKRIGFRAKNRLKVIIANVYEEGVWQDTVFYHPECYEALDQPHGRAFSGMPLMTQEDRDMLESRIGSQAQ